MIELGIYKSKLSVKIGGNKFYELLEIIQNEPVRLFDRENKIWLLDTSSYKHIVPKLKAIDSTITINAELVSHISKLEQKKSILQHSKTYSTEFQEIKGFRAIPKRFQNTGIRFLCEGERVLLADGVGLGKTVQALAAAIKYRNDKKINSVLIISPKAVIKEWNKMINEMTDEKLNFLNESRDYKNKSFFNIINYDCITSDWGYGKKTTRKKRNGNWIKIPLTKKQVKKYKDNRKEMCKFDLVIFDEAQLCGNSKTKRTKIAKKLSQKIPYVFCLSATPLQNHLRELYNIFYLINPGILGDVRNFLDYFCVRDTWGNVIGHKHLPELVERISPYVLRRTRDDIGEELPPITYSRRWVKFTSEQKQMYNEIKKRIIQIRTDPNKELKIKKAMELAQIGYLRQACLSTHLINPNVISSAKLEALDEILDAIIGDDDKVVVYCFYRGMCELIQERYKKYGVIYLNADTSKDLDRFKEEFKNTDKKVFLMTNVGGVGLNLETANHFVFVNPEFNPQAMTQISGRIVRLTQKKNMHITTLLVEGTYEERMVDILDSKTDLFDQTVDGIRFLNNVKENDMIMDLM